MGGGRARVGPPAARRRPRRPPRTARRPTALAGPPLAPRSPVRPPALGPRRQARRRGAPQTVDEGLLKREVSVDDRALVWEFTVIDKPDVNAFVLSGGKVSPRRLPMPACAYAGPGPCAGGLRAQPRPREAPRPDQLNQIS